MSGMEQMQYSTPIPVESYTRGELKRQQALYFWNPKGYLIECDKFPRNTVVTLDDIAEAYGIPAKPIYGRAWRMVQSRGGRVEDYFPICLNKKRTRPKACKPDKYTCNIKGDEVQLQKCYKSALKLRRELTNGQGPGKHLLCFPSFARLCSTLATKQGKDWITMNPVDRGLIVEEAFKVIRDIAKKGF